jgi:hypothetical protein
MNNWLVIGILAGIASGVLYFSAAAGNLAGMMLASFASFPLFVAGLGWGMPTVLARRWRAACWLCFWHQLEGRLRCITCNWRCAHTGHLACASKPPCSSLTLCRR